MPNGCDFTGLNQLGMLCPPEPRVEQCSKRTDSGDRLSGVVAGLPRIPKFEVID
jgi:hypothetical protein